jgi:hypothetical protein
MKNTRRRHPSLRYATRYRAIESIRARAGVAGRILGKNANVKRAVVNRQYVSLTVRRDAATRPGDGAVCPSREYRVSSAYDCVFIVICPLNGCGEWIAGFFSLLSAAQSLRMYHGRDVRVRSANARRTETAVSFDIDNNVVIASNGSVKLLFVT